ncbi:MAG: transglutaminase family protein [Beijerinckiaceae bacterium]|nr:transglutaminase family protein [Beijerinckiaceae bacterium]
MRIHIRHEIAHTFEPPVRFLNATLRLTPRSHESQHIARWRVEIDGDSRIRAFDDGFGNCMHTLSMSGQTETLRLFAEGVVDTFDAAGIVRATVERFPPELFLRETALTSPDDRQRALAAKIEGENRIERLHALLLLLSDDEKPEEPAQEQTQAKEPAAQKQSQEVPAPKAPTKEDKNKVKALVHDFIVCARLVGAPARFVSGYHLHPKTQAGGFHFWAEAHVEGVGWIGFDPANAICPHESHVRMAVGLDALDATCMRIAPSPQTEIETVDVRRQS